MIEAAGTINRQLIDAKEVAELLGCSWRSVLRFADAGRIPWGVKLGGLRRWRLSEIEQFIEAGCRPVRMNPTQRRSPYVQS